MSLVLDKLQDLNWDQLQKSLRDRRVQLGLLAGVTGVFILRKLLTRGRNGLPPGPRGWPLFGNLFGVRSMSNLHRNFKKWRKQYGDIFTIYLGTNPWVILTTPETVREAFITKGNDTAGRVQLASMDMFTDGGKNIVAAQPGPLWKLQRQIAHSAIRKHASGYNLEENLQSAMDSFITAVQRQPDQVVDIPDEMLKMMYNFLASVCFGRQFEYDDPWLTNFQTLFKKRLETLGYGFMSDSVPSLSFMDKGKMKIMGQIVKEFNSLLETELKEHKETLNPEHPRDLTDEILLQIKKREDNPEANPVLAQLEQSHFTQTLLDVFSAGTDTSRITLAITIGLLTQYPEIQAKLHQELDEVLGDTGKVTLKNKDQLPYTNAVVYESMRIQPVAPLGLPHVTTKNTTLGKYNVPKGTTVVAYTYGIHHDPDNFENPEEFNPERWIDENGKLQYKPYKFIPFSMGPRVCVGESLARVDLHVLTAMLFHKYEFRSADGEPYKLRIQDAMSSVEAASFKLKLVERH